MTIRPNETPIQFADRVKARIAKKIGLKNLNWVSIPFLIGILINIQDGYLKYLSPSQRLVNERQKIFADKLKSKLFLEQHRKNFMQLKRPVNPPSEDDAKNRDNK